MRSTTRPAAACPNAETLAAFAEGRLTGSERAALIEHLDGCDDCMAALEAANETIATRNVVPFARRRAWWLAAAAALAIVAISLGVLRERDRSPMQRLVALAPRDARPVEARLSGGFPWASYRGPLRSEDADADPNRMKLIGTAGELVAEANRDRTADAQQAAGVALVVIDKPLQAIDRLRAAVQASPDDAAAWSDLGAAQYAAALSLTRPSMLPQALESVDRALRVDPLHTEARFNRALILERLGLTLEARAAWQRYLEVDAASPWAVEARERMAKIAATPKPQADAQRMRTFAEAETLGQWAEAVKRVDEAAAARELEAARIVSGKLGPETLLRDAVLAIQSDRRATLAEAHSMYRRGRIAYSKRQLDAALPDLTRAAKLFESGASPMALVARYYAASVRFDRNEVAEAREELEALLAEADAHPHYIALGAQVRWELALPLMVDGDWSGALPLLQQSRGAFARLGERNHLGFVESLLADTLLSLGRADEAWAARIRAFALLSADGKGDRLPVSMKAAAQMEIRSGRLEAARALLEVATAAARPIESHAIAADVLIHSALVNAALHDGEAASRSLREATAATMQIADPKTRELAQAHLELAGGAAMLASDPLRASGMLTRAIDGYRASERLVFLPECYLLRARAALRTGRDDAAAEDLESGVAVLERSRIHTGAVVGTGVHDAGNALFEEAIRLSARRGDVERVFAYAERSRAQLGSESVATLRELQQRLGASDTAVLQVIALREELVAICITARDASMRTARADAELYETVIRPFEPQLAAARELIVVPDRALQNVSFAGLYDAASKRHLIERMPVSMAMSASSLRALPRGGSSSLLAIALPSGESNAGLPESASEIADVSSLYPAAVTISSERATFHAFADAAPRASVIHVAGHTERQSEDAGIALAFARARVTWSAIAARRLPQSPVVVLAACETLRQQARSLSLGDGFLAAGATDVVGTLTPIADADARELFRSIHRHLAAGAIPSEAVRAAQLEALARGSRAWRAVASLTRCIHTKERS